ncbi:MAG: aminotransferase class I/II-fold pyridoxal phosphate-dependent enzyme [Paramuribaculum sp.]|nr:aminotransferase class I/II-fold pyridoxal phosphate-dependent enzyme [Paramuribaculum sp.]MDE6489297.1 aminotransferase class I/II-fold pyridoxal phosphate-dependent enzyme [Paramuribaculum sp.]
MSYAETLDRLKAEGNFRIIPQESTESGLIDFSLNDYLGLAIRHDLQDEFFADEANRKIAMTSSASRLLSSRQSEYQVLETRLSSLYSNRPALIFNSGYHANAGLISALASEKNTLILADRLVHASIIDGITLSRAPFRRFPHNDFTRLEELLKREHDNYEHIIIAVESIYSMDGDSSDLETLCNLKKRFPKSILYVDEAHAFGAIGVNGLGLCRSLHDFSEIDIIIGTFGKACASAGAFAIMTPTLRDFAINRARSFIFSTAIAPMTCAWTLFMIDRIVDMNAERQHLLSLANRLATNLGLTDPRYITPIIIGSSEEALRISARLLDEGIKVLPIRTPTVPPGTERLRISLSAAMSVSDIDRLTDSLNSILNS